MTTAEAIRKNRVVIKTVGKSKVFSANNPTEEKGIEAKDLAKLANIDAANLSRIEQGKYSVGLDILSKLAFVLGYHIDFVPNQN